MLQIPAREATRHVPGDQSPAPKCELDLPASQLVEMFDEVQREARSPYLEEHHLNPRGHVIAAEVLARELMARELLGPGRVREVVTPQVDGGA